MVIHDKYHKDPKQLTAAIHALISDIEQESTSNSDSNESSE